jgi:hypothetical protein
VRSLPIVSWHPSVVLYTRTFKQQHCLPSGAGVGNVGAAYWVQAKQVHVTCYNCPLSQQPGVDTPNPLAQNCWHEQWPVCGVLDASGTRTLLSIVSALLRGSLRPNSATSLAPAPDSFRLESPSLACAGLTGPCRAHVVTPRQTLEQVAALHGTTTWQIYRDNSLLASTDPSGMVALRPQDVLAVRPSLGAERLRWQWSNRAGAVLPCCL